MTRKLQYPSARIEVVRKTVGAVTYEDPYDWLQTDTPEALEWQWRQDALAQEYVRAWPHFQRLREAIAQAGSEVDSFLQTPPRKRGSRWFWTSPTSQSVSTLWVGSSPDVGRPLVEGKDLAAQVEEAASLVVCWYEPSPKGEYVAAACIAGGDMYGAWRIIEVATGRVLNLSVPATAQLSGALPGWLPDASGFFISDRLPDGRHRLRFIPVSAHTVEAAEVVFDSGDVPANVAGLTPEVSPDGRYLLALAGPHERIAYMLGDRSSGEWRRFLPEGFHGECSGAWLDSHTYVARVHGSMNPRGRIVAIPVADSRDPSTWRELVPSSEAVLRAVGIVEKRIVVSDVCHCSARFRTFDLTGGDERIVPLDGPGTSTVALVGRRFDSSDALTFNYATFTRRNARYHYDVTIDELRVVGNPGAEQTGICVGQRSARSLDGTRVPYFLVHDTKLDMSRPQPTLLTGYGGFNIAFLPAYLAHLLPFIRAGGILVHANLRGGAEFGKEWHQAGRLACKWNVFLDLFAVAEDLIARNVATADHLAMTGASNGGLLAGAAIAHRPDLFRAVVPLVPVLDQMEPLPPGPQYEAVRSICRSDYGDPQDPVMSKVLFSYSPYHHIREGVQYPAVYQVFGEKDVACMPYHGRKSIARLQASTASQYPMLLRVLKSTGHGATSAHAAAEESAEWLSFVMRELGMTAEPIGSS